MGLKKWTNYDTMKCFKFSMILPALLPFYALIFVQAWDSMDRSWRKIKYLFTRLFKRSVYSEFEAKKNEVSEKIVEMVDEYGDKVIPDFQSNRIIKIDE